MQKSDHNSALEQKDYRTDCYCKASDNTLTLHSRLSYSFPFQQSFTGVFRGTKAVQGIHEKKNSVLLAVSLT